MWTSNSGPPFNQPSKSSTKWAFVRYRPGAVGGGGGSHRLPHDMHSMAAGVVEKSVSTGTTAITGVAGGRSGSSTSRLPRTSNATGGSWSASAVATSTLASPFQIRRCSGTGRYISRGIAPSAARSEEHTSELQSRSDLVCRLLLEKKKKKIT